MKMFLNSNLMTKKFRCESLMVSLSSLGNMASYSNRHQKTNDVNCGFCGSYDCDAQQCRTGYLY
ncbi:hypothetical protein AWY96_02600 [Serratia plymuthica]|nr:hypothetical protein AWY96_02600 [Serratia plymuthica]